MLRWRGLEAVPAGWSRSVVTIGVFDGVHRGHRVIINRAMELARASGHPSVVVPFDPHPSEVVRPGSHPALLTSVRAKADLLEQMGVDAMLVLPFTAELSREGPHEFVHRVLVEGLRASAVVVGESFRFGHKAQGDVAVLAQLGARFGFAAEGVELVRSGDTVYSSTMIRTLVAAGDVVTAALALTREHTVEGVIVRGDQRGRELGYPTANLAPIPHAAVPADGVYAGRILLDGPGDRRRLDAAISIGTNPTFEGRERRVEAYALDPPGDLYGAAVRFAFTTRLRPTLAFSSAEALVERMAVDVAEARAALTGT